MGIGDDVDPPPPGPIPTPRRPEWDGGLTALGGYLYQILGLLGLQAAAETPDLSPNTPELDALLTIVRSPDTQIQHEYLDADGILHQLGVAAADHCILVQFKYSRRQPPEPFRTADLVKIAVAFEESARRAADRGYTVTGYVLLTNRVDGPQLTAVPPDLSDAQTEILQNLLRVRNIPLDDWRQRLERFAADYGCLPPEVRRGINELVGQVTQETGSGVASFISPHMLQRAFTDLPQAEPITYAHLRPMIQQELIDLRDAHGMAPTDPLRREIVRQIEEWLPRRALVILHGAGGNGKSVALWQVAWETTTFVALTRAARIRRSFVATRVSDWGRLPASAARRDEGIPQALERLETANPGRPPPILYLGLDAVDEAPRTSDQYAELEGLLTWFWTEDQQVLRTGRTPRATLIVTCRNPEDITDHWLDLPPGISNDRGLCLLSIEEFSLPELLEVAARRLAPALADSLRSAIMALLQEQEVRHIQASSVGTAPPADNLILMARPQHQAGGSAGVPAELAISPDVIAALQHPAMWAALETLPPTDLPAVLEGAPPALGRLAQAFLDGWGRKVRWRDQRDHRWDPPTLEAVLRSVARASIRSGTTAHPQVLWVQAACASTAVDSAQARTLYSEAASAGLIRRDTPPQAPPVWRWRHPFVQAYLAADLEEGGDDEP